LSFSLTLPAAFVNDLAAGGEVGLFLTAIDPGIGFTFDSRNLGTVSARPALEISALPRPGISGIAVPATDVVISATNGVAGGTYNVLSSTNVALPLSQWIPLATNQLSASGAFAFTLTNATSLAPYQFFILRTR
jgi:hypothetical protein